MILYPRIVEAPYVIYAHCPAVKVLKLPAFPFVIVCDRVIVPAVPAWCRMYTRPSHAQEAADGSVHDTFVDAV